MTGKVGIVDGTAITTTILTIAGVASVTRYVLKDTLDQLPGVLQSVGQVREAWKQLTNRSDEAPQAEDTEEHPPPLARPADDEEPPLAA